MSEWFTVKVDGYLSLKFADIKVVYFTSKFHKYWFCYFIGKMFSMKQLFLFRTIKQIKTLKDETITMYWICGFVAYVFCVLHFLYTPISKFLHAHNALRYTERQHLCFTQYGNAHSANKHNTICQLVD